MHAKVPLRTVQHRTDPTVIGITLLQTVDDLTMHYGNICITVLHTDMVSHYDATAPYTTVLHTGNPAPFLYTTISLLPEHSVLTDAEQVTERRNRKQWLKCRSEGEGTRPEIWMGGVEVAASNSTASSVTIGLIPQRPNGLYHCLSAQSQRKYFSFFFQNSGKHLCFLLDSTPCM